MFNHESSKVLIEQLLSEASASEELHPSDSDIGVMRSAASHIEYLDSSLKAAVENREIAIGVWEDKYDKVLGLLNDLVCEIEDQKDGAKDAMKESRKSGTNCPGFNQDMGAHDAYQTLMDGDLWVEIETSLNRTMTRRQQTAVGE